MSIDMDLNATGFNNWIPMMSIDGALYRYNSTGNAYNGTGAFTVGDSLTNAANGSWVNIVGPNAGAIDDTKGVTNPSLSATSGTVQFGVIQWASQSTGTIGDNEPTEYTLAIDSLNYGVTYTAVPEPSSTALLGLGGLALMLRRRK